MRKILINGNNKISGEYSVQGAKNSVLPVLAATILCDGKCQIINCPQISDVNTSKEILIALGAECDFCDNSFFIDPSKINACTIPENLMCDMRSSIVFLGAIISKMKKAVISSPGGCELGPRPIDLHLEALKKLGVTIKEKHGFLYCEAPDGLRGAEIYLSFPSVGATENIILAAALAEGITVIHNAAKEPEIVDLVDFLNNAGAHIYGAGSDVIYIYGVKKLSGIEHKIIPDRIVAATYLAAAAITGGEIVLKNVESRHLTSIFSVFKECGCELIIEQKSVTLKAPKVLSSVSMVRSLTYPGFPTDAGPIVISMLTLSKGITLFSENIFENRFRYIDELKRLGAKINVEGRVAIIEGVKKLSGAPCRCTDLRGGAALVLAGLAAEGCTLIDEIRHIERGYENIVDNFKNLGADIRYV